ncbi:MAG: hypothetical protein Q7I97_05240 [Thermovirgaceae bacterium]|nr:hypothetical protein [Thermovirgaceae bacterium]
MRLRMSIKARRELLASQRGHYRAADHKDKIKILDEFVSATGYNRKYAITLLNGYPPSEGDTGEKPKPWEGKGSAKRLGGKRQPRLYDEKIKDLLVSVWKMSGKLCSKRLSPFMKELLEVLERKGRIGLSSSQREILLQMSASTIDRLLKDTRRGEKRGISTTRPGQLLKKSIPIRTFSDWNEESPGFFEVDTVSHCGESAAGTYLSTLTITDVYSGWTEERGLAGKLAEAVVEALEEMQKTLPVTIQGLDSDNGSEFINQTVQDYCETKNITFTRGRRYKKNDQCYVEQKNGSMVRTFIGYERYENRKAKNIMNLMYPLLSDFVNFFQPSMKLESKDKRNGKTRRKYLEAKTPYRRLLESGVLGEKKKAELEKRYESLDPVTLQKEISRLRGLLLREAGVPADSGIISEIRRLRKNNEIRLQTTPGLICSKRYNRPAYYPKRHDAFDDLLGDVKRMIRADPAIRPGEILAVLQKDHPGRFCDYQLRTLRRRIKEIETKIKSGKTAEKKDARSACTDKSPQTSSRSKRAAKPPENRANQHRGAKIQKEATICHG